MKKLLITGLVIGLAAGAFGQGQISLDNLFNIDNSPTATSNGLFFYCPSVYLTPVLINTDFNVSFYGGSDAKACFS